MISIHAPVQGATEPSFIAKQICSYFNPRTRAGCDTKETKGATGYTKISIHAPVQGATLHVFDFLHISLISIHAPVQGATSVRLV